MIVAIDFETLDSRGASFEYFRRDFRVFSMSCCWRSPEGALTYWFSTDPLKISQKLVALSQTQDRIVVQNLGFERGVMRACYPNIQLNWHADTMRLTQLRDGGGDEYGEPTLTLEQEISRELGELDEEDLKKKWKKSMGNGLEAASARFLPEASHEHKKPAHDWLKENHGIEKSHGQYLHLLPLDLLEAYNNADTRNTLMLYESHVAFFEEIKYDWSRDWMLYSNRARLMSGAYYDGICIDQPALMKVILDLEAEIGAMEAEFLAAVEPHLKALRHLRLLNYIQKNVGTKKTEKGRLKHIEGIKAGKYDDKWKDFKMGSTQQLAQLFVEVLGMKYKFTTPKGAPSFKTTHLGQWGEYGLILQKRKKRLLVLQQAANTYISAMHDGKTHPSVKVAGTRTGRTAGGRD